jgi:hypothetical protein
MRLIILLIFFLLTFQAFAQNFILPDGEYMDTITTPDSKDTNCISSPYFYYYSLGAKYPKNSASLLNEAQLFFQKQNATYSGSGYVTLRFRIDCQGKMMQKVQVLQTDEQYKNYHFDKAFVNELYTFVKTLDKWKLAEPIPGKHFSYITFITFKIRNGKIINIIP